jgi:hypothetical protein
MRRTQSFTPKQLIREPRMANKVVRTEVLTQEVEGETYYGVLEVYQSKGRLLYRVHYGSDVFAGKDDNWQPTDGDANDMRLLAYGEFMRLIEYARRRG